MPRIDYVFLKNHPDFGSVYLVELSNRANTQRSDLTFCEKYVITPHKLMIPLLKVLKPLSIFNECDRFVILETLCKMSE